MKPSNFPTERPTSIDASHFLGEAFSLIFTNRRGGVSDAPFDSLNLGFRGGDNPMSVSSNRATVASQLGVSVERFVYLHQVHGTTVRRAGSEDGRKAAETGDAFPKTDGAYSDRPLTVLAVLTADCLPLAIGHKEGLFVAMLHAGWKGTLENIASAALNEIRKEFSFRPFDLRAVMGPGIGPCCYHVDEGRANLFVERYGEGSGVVQGGARPGLDLYRANRANLLEEGVKEENINTTGICTCCNPDYFSYRREGVTGRQGAFAFLKTGK
ncbi:MAG: hypothetical protein A2W01_04535 [Candidatus Solincola sediminis]|uniref:Purine nucleoside phosphorylase n=1 Tax=Candidatus Solincola sediminis TaxID=1797199 RepID=A0A1F2WGL6_9ACTN|nr:MAG: hypothetical protein A2Y75_04610 [Candidatus Solincola sediminis]OFW58259.1 MAG: hypothetical protein A2W01_04535 [Candidatus Solincola sediminis]